MLDIRNDLATIGSKQSKATEIVKTVSGGDYGYLAFGRRQDVFAIKTLAGYPVSQIDDEATGKFQVQSLITQAAVKEASQLTKALRLEVRTDYLPPFVGWDIDDKLVVEIKSGTTQINQQFRVVGWRAKMDDGGFSQQLYVTLPVT